MRQERETVVFVKRNDDLAITVAFEAVLLGQLFAVLFITIKLTINDGVNVAFVIMERLIAFGTKVNDRESHMAKSCRQSVSEL